MQGARMTAPFTCQLCGQRIDDGKPCGCGARMTVKGYQAWLALGIDPGSLGDLVAMMPVAARQALHAELVTAGCGQLVRTLWFDYDSQRFI